MISLFLCVPSDHSFSFDICSEARFLLIRGLSKKKKSKNYSTNLERYLVNGSMEHFLKTRHKEEMEHRRLEARRRSTEHADIQDDDRTC